MLPPQLHFHLIDHNLNLRICDKFDACKTTYQCSTRLFMCRWLSKMQSPGDICRSIQILHPRKLGSKSNQGGKIMIIYILWCFHKGQAQQEIQRYDMSCLKTQGYSCAHLTPRVTQIHGIRLQLSTGIFFSSVMDNGCICSYWADSLKA